MELPEKLEMEITDNQTVGKPTKPSSDLIQIHADKNEIQRRIAALMTRKRKEIDELNIQEFCNLPRAEMASEFSCARVDAVFVRRGDSHGHVKVSKVDNEWGPQTMPTKLRNLSQVFEKANEEELQPHLSTGIEERLGNMEAHLNIKTGSPDKINVYERLKNLEDRILFLEGLSPDYFSGRQPLKYFRSSENDKRQSQRSPRKKDLTLDEINARKNELINGLLKLSSGQRI